MIYVWAGVIALALIIEFVSMELVSIWFALSAIASLILAAIPVGVEWQIITFLVLAILMLLVLRRFAANRLNSATTKTNADSHIGKITTLVTEIKNKESVGTIKLNGVTWNVSSTVKIAAGVQVEILEMQGNKFIVKKVKEKK